MTKIVFKTAYQKRVPCTFETVGPSLTHQSMADECDMNRIMERWDKTGILEHRNTYEGQYGDFADLPMDYHESMNAVVQAQEMFQTLPSKVRRQFGNDPGAFLDFVTDPSNKKAVEDMGLAKPPEGAVIEPPSKNEGTPQRTPKAAPAASPAAPQAAKSEPEKET